ncbi:MAG: glycosyl hydrolase, partial [Bacteroidetes bacterium]|nr:glycosyl hydrolase [Bacteroidota bacterium]
ARYRRIRSPNALHTAPRPVLANYPARNIGPTQQGGRIVDLDADPRNAKVLYVAYASGGVWKTTNNGMSFSPIFDEQGTMGIGDIAVSTANPDIIWVGTGECNSSRSSYAGMGVYRSSDAGKTWAHKGLTGTQHISRVVTHPTDINTAWVASIGALYTTNEDRGVFKTTDGGATWRKTLYINPETGVIDLSST